ncbi:rhomboid family intramembrane serine protease [Metabacillus schmidteae]|uniref:rhomboid family intramembrane serine protease n=1 Tax=Metabacillus schmidteae TaxID=2730405 RepID=UPI0015892AA0|nr:rhomboid family intramembrane serine protease [Metabacillus schmidteae]
MAFEQDFVYWSIIDQLVVEQNFTIIAVSQDGNEIVLQPHRKKQFSLIRLRRADVDWGNTLAVDIEQSGRRFEQLLKSGVRGPLTVLNIYFSPLAPVDDYPDVFIKGYSEGYKGKIDITSMMVRNDNLEESLEKIQQAMTIHLDVQEILSNKEINEEDIQVIRKKVSSYQKELRDAERKLFQNGKPFFTNVFLAIQILMFLVLELNGGSTNTETLIQFGAKFNPLIYEGEWWRFVSPIILHIGFLHLLMNSFALFYIGPAVERAYGKWKFLFIYIVAGVSGSLVSFAFSPFVSAGASGAIFGCFGALLFLGVYNRKVFFRTMGSNLLIVVGINIALGFVIPNIDNAGHIGGLIGGFLAALIVQLPHHKKVFLRIIGIIGSLVLLLGLYQFGMNQAEEQYPEYVALKGQELIQDEKFEDAYNYLHESVSADYKTNDVMFLFSVAAIQLQKYDEAIDYLQQIISDDDSYHPAHYNLAILYANQQNNDQALEEVNQALKYDPNNKQYQALKDELTAK